MNEQVRNILEQSTTKTSKIEQLLRLGLMLSLIHILLL